MDITAQNINQLSRDIPPVQRDTAVAEGEAPPLSQESANVPALEKGGVEIPSREAKGKGKDASPLDQARKAVENLNEAMNELQTSLGFSVREEDRQVVVTVTNRSTDEVIRQIPAEEVLQIRDKMAEITGLLFDKKV
jgi:flagellar protein FlaG